MIRYLILFILSAIVLCCCKTSSKTRLNQIINTQRAIMPADSIILKQKKGIDFFAEGNSPANWQLNIDFDKIISFKSSDGTFIETLPAFENKSDSSTAAFYRFTTDLGLVEIRISGNACSSVSGNITSEKMTSVLIQNREYTGCGNYLFDHRLNDVWELEAVNNVQQYASQYQSGLPFLVFNLQKNTLGGSNGCNGITANIEMKGNRIKFSSFTSTLRSCSTPFAEKMFNEKLSNKLVDYFMQDGKLILYLIDDSKLKFKRKAF